jgi:hypothetical protein
MYIEDNRWRDAEIYFGKLERKAGTPCFTFLRVEMRLRLN